MRTLETLRTFETKQYRVTVRAVEDCDLDLSWDEDGEVLRQLENGTLQCFGVVASVTHKATGIELGEDSLLGCIYKTPAEFMDHRECGKQNRELRASGSTAIRGSYFSDMIREAIGQARKNLDSLTQSSAFTPAGLY